MVQTDPVPKSKILYDAANGPFDLGSYEEFNQKLQDDEKRKLFYDAAKSKFDLGTFDEFSSKVVTSKKKDETGLDVLTNVPPVPDEMGGQRVDQKVTLTPPSKSPSQDGVSDSSKPEPLAKPKEKPESEKSMLEKSVDFAIDFTKMRFEQGKDVIKSLAGGSAAAVAGIAGIPNFVNKTAFTAALNINKALGVEGIEEFAGKFDAIPADKQEEFINKLITEAPVNMPGGAMLGGVSASAQNFLTDLSEGILERTHQYETALADDVRNLEFDQAAARVANGVAQSAAYFAMAALPGGLGVIAGSTASQRQEEQERAGEKINANTILNSWADGTAEAVFEIPTAALVRPIRKILMGDRVLAKKFSKAFVPQMLKSVGLEGISEGLTEITQQLTDDFFLGKDPDKTSKDFWDRVKEAALIGAVSGGMFPIVTRIAADRMMSADRKKQLSDIDDRIKGIDANLNKDLAAEIVDDLNEIKGELTAKKEEIIDSEYQKFKELPEADRKALGDLEKELDRLKDEYEAIEESNLDKETKDDLKKKKAKEAEELYDEKTKIVEPDKSSEKIPNKPETVDKQDVDEKKSLEKPPKSEPTSTEKKKPFWDSLSEQPIDALEEKLEESKVRLSQMKSDKGRYSTSEIDNAESKVNSLTRIISEKKGVQSKEVNVGKGTFRVDTDSEGKVKAFKQDGTEIPEFIDRKLKKGGTKKVKNPAYSSIYAKATGTITENQAAKERDEKWKAVKNDYTPSSPAEVVDLAIANGAKVSRESVESELGERAKEMVWATGLKKEAELPSIERLGEILAEENPELGFESQDYRNAIIDALSSYSDVNSIRDEYISRMEQQNDPYAGLSEQEQLEAYKGSLTEKELSLLESVEFNEGIDNLSENEITQYYEQEYSKQIESLPESEQAELYAQLDLDNAQQAQPRTPEAKRPAPRTEQGKKKPKPEKRVEKPTEATPEIQEADKQIAEAEKAVQSAQTALDNKAKKLDKTIVEDQEDLFGDRKSAKENQLFDERVDISKREEATAAERKALQDAKDNLKALQEKKKALESGNEASTGKLKFTDKLDKLDQQLKDIDKSLVKFGKETLGVNLPVAIARTAVIAMRGAIRTAKTVGEVIDAGWNAIKATKWWNNLKGSEQHDLQVQGLMQILNDTFAAHNAITPEQAAQMTDDTYKESNAALNNKPKNLKERVERAKRGVIKKITDRQYLSKKLVHEAGMGVLKALMINSHGSSGKAKQIFGEAYEKIWQYLKKGDREMLDKIIFLRRIITIDTNRTKKGFTQVMHPKGLDADTATKALEMYKSKLGDEKYNDLVSRADQFFKVYEELLDAKYENGLISKPVYESLKGLDYEPRLYLDHILDFEGKVNMGRANVQKSDTGGLSEEQIKSLDEGSMNNLVMQSEWLLSTSIAAAAKSMAMNNINKQFIVKEYPKAKERYDKLRDKIDNEGYKPNRQERRFLEYFEELDSKFINNPIVSMKPVTAVPPANTAFQQIGTAPQPLLKPVYMYSESPKKGFSRAYWYDKGVKNEFFLEDGLHESWFDNANGLLAENWREYLSYASGSALLKGIATGNNPSFAIVNSPRDYLFTAVFSDQYSIFLPKSLIQVARDAARGGIDIYKFRKGQRGRNLLNQYIDHGGNMDWLSTQGRLKKDTQLAKAIDAVVSPRFKDRFKTGFSVSTLRGFSMYSEIVFRLALFKRSIKNELRSRGYKTIDDVEADPNLTDIEKKEMIEDIYNLATANARSLLDFNQGGTLSKDAESLLPYINTAIQGTRVAADALTKNPAATTARVLQACALGSSAMIAAGLGLISYLKDDDDERSVVDIWFDGMNGISDYQKMMYFNFPTGQKNSEGEDRVLRIAKNHQLTPILAFIDGVAYNVLAKIYGREEKMGAKQIYNNTFNAFNANISPVSLYNAGSGTVIDGVASGQAENITRNPALKAILTFATGYDYYRDQPLARNVNEDPKPLEGQNLSSVEDFYKKLGREYGLSPVRVKAWVESFITQPSTNPYIGGMYALTDAVTSDDKTLDQMGKDLARDMSKAFVKRLVTYTSDFNRSLNAKKGWQDELYKLTVDEGFSKIDQKDLARRYTEGKVSVVKFDEELQKYSPNEQQAIVGRIKEYTKLSMVVDRNIIDIKYGGSARRRALMILKLYGDIYDGSPEMNNILNQMKTAGGILTESVLQEYESLKKEIGTKNK